MATLSCPTGSPRITDSVPRSLAVLVVAVLLLSPVVMASAAGDSSNASGGLGVGARSGGERFGVGEIVVTYTDHSRWVTFPGHRPVPRQLVTVIRYPAAVESSRVDVLAAPPARSAGPFPLVLFAEGYDITPAPYARLLQTWAQAGYVVAAPIFPPHQRGRARRAR